MCRIKQNTDGNLKSKPGFKWLSIAMLTVLIGVLGFSANASAAIVTDQSTVYAPEGSFTTFNVWLDTDPLGPLTVNISNSAGDADITVAPPSVTFTSGDYLNPRVVTVSAAEDVDTVNGSATITLDGAAYGSTTVTANEVENDTTFTLTIQNPGTGSGTVNCECRESLQV